MRARLIMLAGVSLMVASLAVSASPGTAGTLAPRLTALGWAESQAGAPYVWGGTGPGYDCSGLVMTAYARAGISIPRTTYEMLSSSRLYRVWRPLRGDLAFFGSGHVELVQMPYWHRTWGAQEPGTYVGSHKWNDWWHPTMFFRVRIR